MLSPSMLKLWDTQLQIFTAVASKLSALQFLTHDVLRPQVHQQESKGSQEGKVQVDAHWVPLASNSKGVGSVTRTAQFSTFRNFSSCFQLLLALLLVWVSFAFKKIQHIAAVVLRPCVDALTYLVAMPCRWRHVIVVQADWLLPAQGRWSWCRESLSATVTHISYVLNPKFVTLPLYELYGNLWSRPESTDSRVKRYQMMATMGSVTSHCWHPCFCNYEKLQRSRAWQVSVLHLQFAVLRLWSSTSHIKLLVSNFDLGVQFPVCGQLFEC